MRKIFFVLSLFICFLSKGQSNGDPTGFPTVNSAPYYKFNGFLQNADGKAIIFGSTDTTWHPRFAGTVVYKASDSTLYKWTGNIWQAVGSGSGGSIPIVPLTQIAFGNGINPYTSSSDFVADTTGGSGAIKIGINNASPTVALDVLGEGHFYNDGDGVFIREMSGGLRGLFDGGADEIAAYNQATFRYSYGAGSLLLGGTPNVNLAQYGQGLNTGTQTYGLGVDASGNVIEVSIPGGEIVSGNTVYQFQDSTNTPPVSFPVGIDSVYYMVGGAGTGIFSGHNYEIALYINGVFNMFIPPVINDWGLVLTGAAQNTWHQYDGSTWPRRNAPAWVTSGNYGGGILGSINASNVYFVYNNSNRLIFQGNGIIRFPTKSGVSDGLAGLAASTGALSNVQIGTGLQLSAGTLSATTGVNSAVLPITYSSGIISTSMATNKLIGRSSASAGVMEEITVGSGLSLSGGTLSSTVSGGITTADNGLTANTATNVRLGGALVTNTTISGAFTLNLNSSRLIASAADSISLTATNSWSATSLAGLNLWAVTLTGRATTSTVTATNVSTFASNTGTGDSTGWHMQITGAVTGIRGLGIAYSSGAANRVLLEDTVTKKVSWSTFDASSLVNYWARTPSSGGVGRIYPSVNIGDTVQFGYSGTGTNAAVYNARTFRNDGGFAIGGANVSATSAMVGTFSSSTAGIIGITMTTTSSSATGVNVGVQSSIGSSTTTGTANTTVGVLAQSTFSGATGTTGTVIGLQARAQHNSATSGSALVLDGVYATVALNSTNAAGAIGRNANAIYTTLENSSASVDSFRWWHDLYLDTVPSNLVSSGNVWGIFQKGTNKVNFFAGKMLHGYIAGGDTVPTMQLQMGAGRFGLAKGADVASANDLTLGGDGNVFHITGTTTINAITTAGWVAGSVFYLIFDASVTVKNATAGGAGTAQMKLAGAVDFSATASDVLTLVWDGTSFFEVSRSVN